MMRTLFSSHQINPAYRHEHTLQRIHEIYRYLAVTEMTNNFISPCGVPNWTMIISHKMLSINLTLETDSFYHDLPIVPARMSPGKVRQKLWRETMSQTADFSHCFVVYTVAHNEKDLNICTPPSSVGVYAGVNMWNGVESISRTFILLRTKHWGVNSADL